MKTQAHKPLLSRVANAVYWMGRYIERAENVARFIDVNHNLMLDLPSGSPDQWQPIVDTTGDHAEFEKRYGAATQVNVVRFLAFDPQNPNSIYSCVLAARENARSVRETISSEMWQQINTLYLLIASAGAQTVPDSLPQFCHTVRMACHLFQGITEKKRDSGHPAGVGSPSRGNLSQGVGRHPSICQWFLFLLPSECTGIHHFREYGHRTTDLRNYR